jgi:hypothetical protein
MQDARSCGSAVRVDLDSGGLDCAGCTDGTTSSKEVISVAIGREETVCAAEGWGGPTLLAVSAGGPARRRSSTVVLGSRCEGLDFDSCCIRTHRRWVREENSTG